MASPTVPGPFKDANAPYSEGRVQVQRRQRAAKATPAAADKRLCLLCDFGWPSGVFALFDAAKAVTIGR
jgi:hypothetical protein